MIDAKGRYVTPGIVDSHSHLGVYPAPGVDAHQDGNEMVKPNTAEVWSEHSVWPQDPQFPRSLAGGVTALQVLPGSANLFGGRGAVLKVVPARSVQEMKFPGAKYGLKMACGENPKRVYAQKGPATRMGNVAGYRAAWIEAEGLALQQLELSLPEGRRLLAPMDLAFKSGEPVLVNVFASWCVPSSLHAMSQSYSTIAVSPLRVTTWPWQLKRLNMLRLMNAR